MPPAILSAASKFANQGGLAESVPKRMRGFLASARFVFQAAGFTVHVLGRASAKRAQLSMAAYVPIFSFYRGE
jgi:hypothetical protein